MVATVLTKDGKPMYQIPISQRPSHGPLYSKIFFPLLFCLGQLFINTTQFLCLPLLLVPVVGRRSFDSAIGWTKDGYGRLLIAITCLFAPHSIILTTDSPPSLTNLVERDENGRMTKINLPDRLVIMSNHQAYSDWMYLWILACYSGHAKGIIILLKISLKNLPVVGWGMQFFNFIFMRRSWIADKTNLTKALLDLGRKSQSKIEKYPSDKSSLLSNSSRAPLWLIIFPEGTITSDEEGIKSKRYADKENIEDFETLLLPRSTGLLFSLRTLLPQIPDLKLMDVTIGYPGVKIGEYPQNHYGLLSIFLNSIPPPCIHIHLHIYDQLSSHTSGIPSLVPTSSTGEVTSEIGLTSPEDAKEFELWLRGVWREKEERMKRFYKDQRFYSQEGGENAREVIPIQQTNWWHWIGAAGGGGIGTVALLSWVIWRMIK
ncbi:acyltransferase [Tremella mesenterica]|uniref:Acyltransferase n=1 Tax=Tremella mesenterica TaxID=5217 RepID=A0A4Q1BNS5_TREME|nr:acyltransferase [Tremella mesenterica]